MKKVRWVHRISLDGDIYYDRDTRRVYRSRPRTMANDSQYFWSLPTFESQAPLKVYFDFTYFCNLECRHCITNSSPRIDRKSELKPERIKSIMNELASIGVLELGIGGGEPLCHSELFNLISHASMLQLNTVLTTNGILVTNDIAEKLKKSGVFEVRVSFDGSQPVHDSIRGAGIYLKALKATKVLINSGVTTVPRLTLCNDDAIGLDKLFTDLKSVGATQIKACIIEPRGRASLLQNQDMFKYHRDITTSTLLLEMAQKHGIKLSMPSDLAGCAELADGGELRLGEFRSCGAGLETAYISPTGDVQPCSGTPEHAFGSVKTNSFMTVWIGDIAKAWRLRAHSTCSWCLCIQKLGVQST